MEHGPFIIYRGCVMIYLSKMVIFHTTFKNGTVMDTVRYKDRFGQEYAVIQYSLSSHVKELDSSRMSWV